MSAFSNLRQMTGRALRWPAGYFHAEWERMAPRTRKLALGLMVTIAGVLAVGITYYSFSEITTLKDENEAIREALGELAKHHDEYLEAKTRNAISEARIGNDPPQLTADLEAAARGENVQ